METIRFGLVGLGNHGLRYARHLAAGEVAGAILAAVCRRDRERGEEIARELGVRFTPDYRSLLSDASIDAVALVVPCDLHPPLVAEALAAGKAVLVEKPLGPDADAARRILEAASHASRPVMVAQTLRFNAVVRALRQRREEIGPLRFLSLSQRFEPSRIAWMDQPAAGGILRNSGVHAFDLVRYFAEREVVEVSCFQGRSAGQRMEDSFAALLRLEGGILAVVDNERTTASRSGRIELVGERGQLVADHLHHRLLKIEGATARQVPIPDPVPTVRDCLQAFTKALQDGSPVPIPLSEGLRAVEIVDACRRSAETGLPQRVEREP